jgi:hypothetical protein
MFRRSLILDPADNVAVVVEDAKKGDIIQAPEGEIVLLEDVEFAHKVAIVDFAAEQSVYKHSHEIGQMMEATPKGRWIHSHNMKCDRGKKPRSV